jgi:hypothetical protein
MFNITMCNAMMLMCNLFFFDDLLASRIEMDFVLCIVFFPSTMDIWFVSNSYVDNCYQYLTWLHCDAFSH